MWICTNIPLLPCNKNGISQQDLQWDRYQIYALIKGKNGKNENGLDELPKNANLSEISSDKVTEHIFTEKL